jgi:hypothetical protein
VSGRKLRGQDVTATLDIYPAHGAYGVSPDLYEFFTRHWDAECRGLAEAGYAVTQKPPAMRGAPLRRRPGQVVRNQWLTGRDVALGSAVALVCGVALLVMGLTFGVGWLAVVGGGVLGALALLTLLVIFLSS